MTGANATLQTCNAWDRDRMDWKGPLKTMTISARDASNTNEVNGDINASNPAHAGIYLLRDFVTTGDAIRIKLPFLTNGEFPQWIWIENHRTNVNNGSSFDMLKFQDNTCVDDAKAGLYMYLQIDKNNRQGSNIYGGFTNYLQTIPASGLHDVFFENNQQQNDCVNNAFEYPFYRLSAFENPFTGVHYQQMIPFDNSSPIDNLIFNNEGRLPYIEKVGSNYIKRLPHHGTAEMAFTLNGKNKIDIGTNPSMAAMMNLVHIDPPAPNISQNNRKILLNGISVEILNEDTDGNISVQVRFDDVDVNNDIRWCADEVVLNTVATSTGYSLNLKSGKTITLDQGISATRIDNPIIYNGKKVFASPTIFKCETGSWFNMEDNSHVILENGSTLKLETGSKYVIENNADLTIKNGCSLYLDACSKLVINGNGKLIVENGGALCISDGAILDFENGQQNFNLQNGYIIPIGYINPFDIVQPYNSITSNNEIWTNKNYFIRELTILPNAKLTLQNSKLIFTDELSKLIINTSGILISDNSILISDDGCGENKFWQGIELHGTSSTSQLTPGAQGIVELKNGAVIENALQAIRTIKINTDGSADWNTTGGIVKADGAVFRNNKNGIWFGPYQNTHPVTGNPMTNVSYFKNCIFETTNAYIQPSNLPYEFVGMYKVQGIRFLGCTFQNTATGAMSGLGSGIRTFDARFTVDELCLSPIYPCTSFQRSVFKNLNYGVKVQGSNAAIANARINNADFDNNFRGVFIRSANNSVVTNNHFNVGANVFELSPQPFEHKAYGLYIESSTGFTIEENTFETNHNSWYGTVVNNLGKGNNRLYRNQFNGFKIATLSMG